jgi:transcriptional regulator with GAF, ATPase, and Fis domain
MAIRCLLHGTARARLPEIRQTLADAGLAISGFTWEHTQAPGIVFFDEVSDAVITELRIASGSRLYRILAVSLGSSPVPVDQTWRLIEAGAADVLHCDASLSGVSEVAARFRRWQAIDEILYSALVENNVVGSSPVWRHTLRQAIEIARFTDAAVLISGESGTGKELIARLVHTLDSRPEKRDLVILDCTTIVPELSGSEFFGHERGAFTGAVSARDGAFALADGGTLFLDEVGELPMPMQAQLLRVVQEGTYKRVGGNSWQQTRFRLVCATNRDLLDEVAGGRFRRDLYYRIAAVTCHLPPLRERREDIPLLIRHFLTQLKPDGPVPALDDAVHEYALQRDYPGNVRDLRQLVARIHYRHVGDGPITVGDIPPGERPESTALEADRCNAGLEHAVRLALSQGIGLKEIARLASECAIRIALAEEGGNLQRAAKRLGITDRALQMRRADSREKGAPDDGYGGNGGDPGAGN